MGLVAFFAAGIIGIFAQHAAHNSIPKYVWFSYLALVVGCLAGGWDEFTAFLSDKSDNFAKVTVGTRLKRWQEIRRLYGHWIIRAGVVLNIWLLWECVKSTGGALDSPFAPMLGGPAIFGAFVAGTERGIWTLVLATGLFIGWEDFGAKTVTASDAYAYFLPQVSLLIAAASISWLQLRRGESWRRARTRPSELAPRGLSDPELRAIGETVIAALRGLEKRNGND